MIVNALLRGRSLSQFKNLGDCDLVILANDTDQEIQTIDGLKEYLIDKEINLVENMVATGAIGYHKMNFFNDYNVTKLIRPYLNGIRKPGSSGQNIPLKDNFLGDNHKEFMFGDGKVSKKYEYDYPGTGIAAIAYAVLDCKPDVLNIVGLDFYDNLFYDESNYLIKSSPHTHTHGYSIEGLTKNNHDELRRYQRLMQEVLCKLAERNPNVQVNLITKCKSFISKVKTLKNLKIENCDKKNLVFFDKNL